MGAGSRSTHQHHRVDPGLTGVAAATAPPPGPVEQLAVPGSSMATHLAWVRDPDGEGEGEPTGTLEVTFASGVTYRFAGVPATTWDELRDAAHAGYSSIGRLVNRRVIGQGEPGQVIDPDQTLRHHADLRAAAAAAGDPGPGLAAADPPAPDPAGPVASGPPRHCPRCGQFIGAAAHPCPLDAASASYYYGDHVGIRTANVTALRRLARAAGGPVRPELAGTVTDPDTGAVHCVSGRAVLEGSDPAAAAAELSCTCGTSDCGHRRLAAAELLDRVHSDRVRTPHRHATRQVLAELGVDHAASQAAQHDARAAWPDDPDVSYLDDPAAFQSVYAAARARAARGEAAVPYLTENATGGLGSRFGGRGFGVELEFDLDPGTDRAAALAAVGEDLHRAGLSRQTRMVGYHAGRGGGYSDARNAWRLEYDATVAGEVVSPILYDTPETWRDLGTVCDIIRRHGGTASVRSGGHVHVSAHNYDHTVENHARLLGLVNTYEDTLYRLAANPARGRHRGLTWCRPNNSPAVGYSSLATVRNHNYGHHLAVNLQAMQGRASDHVEFRMWDSSLDPAVIQSQINLSLGLTEAAFRTASDPAAPNGGQIDRVGAHRSRFGGRGRGARLRGPEWRESTRSLRSLLDTVFPRAAAKAQAAALFAVTRWQRS